MFAKSIATHQWREVPRCPQRRIRLFRMLVMCVALLLFTTMAIAQNISGWWWNKSEGGRGIFLEQQSTSLFLAAYLYDSSGRATWYVATLAQEAAGTYAGQLSSYGGGQTLSGVWKPAAVSNASAGAIRLVFSDSSHATLTWPGGTLAIERFEIVPGGVAAARPLGMPQTGWWWNTAEPGRGFSIELQGDAIFVGGFMYDAAGNPIWYVSSATAMSEPRQTHIGQWVEYGGGQTLTGTYRAPSVVAANAGTLTLRFDSSSNAALTLPDGRQTTLTRFAFGTTGTCIPRTAPVGAAAGTNELMPGGQRVRTATSADGLSFTRTGTTVLDQAATPSLVLSPAGLPLLYYTAHKPDGQRDGAALSVGNVDGTQWTHCQLTFQGLPSNVSPVDPDVVRLADGSLRMFITAPVATSNNNLLGIHYADSPDGFVWTYKGLAFQHTSSIIDSMTFQLPGGWHSYVLDAASIDMVYGQSATGTGFSFVNQASRTMDGQPYVISQAAEVAGVMRLYAFGPNGQVIRSFTTTDGSTLTASSVVHLSFSSAVTEEKRFIKDPAVLRLPNGKYLMAYSTSLQ